MNPRQRSSATPLAWALGALVLYASLYPFSDWRAPAGRPFSALLVLPWPPWQTPLDEAFNLIGYVPLGLMVFVAAVRGGTGAAAAFALVLAGSSLLSYGCEVAQHYLPNRHPSLKDWLMNTLGAGIGALVGALLHATGWLRRWQRLRQRLFLRQSAGALALLALWPVSLLFPAPVPWGLGQLWPQWAEPLAELLRDVPWASGAFDRLSAVGEPQALSPLAERAISMLGLLAPIALAYSVMRPGLRRLAAAAAMWVLGFASLMLSTALNFGPGHAWAWLTPAAMVGALGAAIAALALLALPPRLVQGLALVALTWLIALVSQAPSDPYFAHNLQSWEQGRFVRFHGLAQWFGWLWPFAAIGWLLVRIGRNEPAS